MNPYSEDRGAMASLFVEGTVQGEIHLRKAMQRVWNVTCLRDHFICHCSRYASATLLLYRR